VSRVHDGGVGTPRALRVLWLTNIPLPAVSARLDARSFAGGGWLTAGLEALVREAPEIEVVCAARSWPVVEPFSVDGIRYVTWAGTPPARRWAGLIQAWTDGLGARPPVEEIRRIIDQVQPDIVHVHGTETPNALGALLAARPSATPVLVSIQGLVSEIAPLFLSGVTASDRVADVLTTDFVKGRGVLHAWRRMRRAATTERAALRLLTDAGGRTEWDRRVVERAAPSAHYRHLGEVLRQPFYTTSWSDRAPDEPVVLAVTSSAPYKGIDVLLRGFTALRTRTPARLRIIGDVVGTPLWRSLERLQQSLGIAEYVEWVGPRGAEDVARAMAGCSVFVCASRIENSSNGVCEAMLVGAPVAASRTGGLPSLITDGVDGLLFEQGDPTALCDAVSRLLADRDLAASLGSHARSTASKRHDPATVGRALADAYAEIAGETRRGAAGTRPAGSPA